MNYSEMIDFEINVEVAKRYLPCDYYINQAQQTVDLISTQTYLGPHGEPDEREVKYGEFNPVGSWADAGPIIHDCKINIDYRESIKAGPMAKLSGDNSIYAVNKNELRAAMEVFLMIEDGL